MKRVIPVQFVLKLLRDPLGTFNDLSFACSDLDRDKEILSNTEQCRAMQSDAEQKESNN